MKNVIQFPLSEKRKRELNAEFKQKARNEIKEGMAKAKSLALKGLENSFNESLIRRPFIDSVKSIEVS